MVELSEERIKRQLQQMDPYDFEELVAEIWEIQGYKTTVSSGSGDRGIDIEATRETPFTQKILIQTKRYAEGNRIGSQDVRKYATLYQQEQNVDSVVLVTASSFTPQAEQLAKDLNVKTIAGGSLAETINQHWRNLEKFNIEDVIDESTPTLDENVEEDSSIEEVSNIDKLKNCVSSMYEIAPEYPVFQWPVDTLGQRWIPNVEYLSIQFSSENHTVYQESILLQYVVTTEGRPTVKPRIVVNLGKDVVYSDIEKKFQALEAKYDCSVIEHNKMPGTSVIFEVAKEEYTPTMMVSAVSFIAENIFESSLKDISNIEYMSVESGISSLCSECGNVTGDDDAFCGECGSNLSEGKINVK